MLSEQITHILAALVTDFMQGGSKRREVFLYGDDVKADGVTPLRAGRAVKVTFEYCDAPKVEETRK